MKKTNYLSLNGRCLQTFLTVLEEGSVSNAAERLSISQSAVSHSLDKLRETFDDPLFVRSGRSIEATQRAITLRDPVQAILDDLKKLTEKKVFDPAAQTLEFKIAANDFQRNLIFPLLLQDLSRDGIDTQLRFISSGIPDVEVLRQKRCDIMITPFPPEGSDIYQLRLFSDHLRCFYDEKMREAPNTWEAFCRCDLVEASFTDHKGSLAALSKRDLSSLKKPTVRVPNLGAIEAFIQGSEKITVTANLMKVSEFKNLSNAPLPFETNQISMYLVWHKRNHENPAHQWFREKIKLITKKVLQLRGHPPNNC